LGHDVHGPQALHLRLVWESGFKTHLFKGDFGSIAVSAYRVKPRIAIPVPNSTRPDYVARALPQYENAVRDAGGEPVVIPAEASNAEIAQAAKRCDGVLLPGSPADVDPEKYGAERHPKTAPDDAFRNNADELLLQDAYNMRKPIFGICYGLQSLNVWRTGTLDQELPAGVKHDAGRSVAEAHRIKIEAGSKLATILREAGALPKQSTELTMPVNSSHHQALEVPGDGLRLVAWCSEDCVKEAVESTALDHFVLGVQWHPEQTYNADAGSRALFSAFVHAAAQWHKRLSRKQQDFESVEHSS
jgi:putative glutamine amidotransferase